MQTTFLKSGQSPKAEKAGMGPATVLFLAANPVRGQPLELGEECRAIERKMEGAKFRDRIRLVSQWAARPCDLLEALTDYAPAVLHFSGHGAGHQGLCFQADDGSPVRVSSEALMETMRAEGGNVKLAVLNACFSEVQAKHLMAHIPCVIGMPDLIGDKAGIIYAAYVYRALASGKSVAKAHQHGIAALALHRSHGPSRDIEPAVVPSSESQVSHPMLLTRSGIDADHIYIVHGAEDPALQMRVGQNQQKAVCILTVKATLREFDERVIARVRAELRRLSSDVALEIIDIDEGSVRLSLSLSVEAVRVLQEKRANGELPEICGFEVLTLELRERAELGMTAHVEAEQVSAGRLAQERRIIHAIRRMASTGSAPTSAWIESTLNLAASTGTGNVALATHPSGLDYDPDADVLGLVAAGDMTGALRALMQRHATSVYRYCREALRDRALAEDVQQQVFMSAFRDLPKFSGRSTVRAWLFAIARHRVLDAAKSRRRARSHVEGEDATDIPDPRTSPGERPDDVRLREALVVCLQKLAPHVLTTLLLRYQQGFTFEEMADVCHEKPGTLQAQVARALPALRACIETRTGMKL